jgi:hypothetical protein
MARKVEIICVQNISSCHTWWVSTFTTKQGVTYIRLQTVMNLCPASTPALLGNLNLQIEHKVSSSVYIHGRRVKLKGAGVPQKIRKNPGQFLT